MYNAKKVSFLFFRSKLPPEVEVPEHRRSSYGRTIKRPANYQSQVFDEGQMSNESNDSDADNFSVAFSYDNELDMVSVSFNSF